MGTYRPEEGGAYYVRGGLRHPVKVVILSDEAIEIAIDEIAKALATRGLSDKQIVEKLRDEANRVETELSHGN